MAAGFAPDPDALQLRITARRDPAADAFDPAEFAAFKAQSGPAGAAPAPATDDAFDPSEFAAFKAGQPAASLMPTGAQDRRPPQPRMTREAFDRRFYGDVPGAGVMSYNLDTTTPLGAGLQAKADAMNTAADERLIGKPSFGNDLLSTLFGAGQSASLNGAGTVAAGFATAVGNLDKIGLPRIPGYSPRSFSDNLQRFNDLRDAYSRQAPKAALAGTIGGAVASAPFTPGLKVAQGASLGARALRYGATGAGYGAVSGGLEHWNPLDAAKGAAAGFALGAPAGLAVEKIAPKVASLTDSFLQRVGLRAAPAPRTTLLPAEEAAMRSAGLDPSGLSADQTKRHLDAFAAKGVSPAVAREAAAAEFGLPLSRGQATLDPAALALEQQSLAGQRGAKAQTIGQDFAGRQQGAVLNARDTLLQALAGGRKVIDNPARASEGVADSARRLADQTARGADQAQAQADRALAAVRGYGLPPDPIDAATTVGQSVRDAAAQGRAAYRQGYAEVAAIPGTFSPGALDRMGTRMRDRLGADVPVDDVLTPAATRALADLDRLPGLFALEPGQGPNLQQVDQLRKRLVSYHGNTGQNPTDRRAMDRILSEFDAHVHDAMDLGQFNRGAQRGAPTAAADDFPGTPSMAPADAIPMPDVPRGAPEPMGRFIARNGGIAMTGDARAADLHRAYYPGAGTLARRDGIPLDQWRVKLAEAGYLHPDETGGASARDVSDIIMDSLRAERTGAGQARYRFEDEARIGGQRAADRVADQNSDHAAMIDRQARKLEIDLEGYGLRPQDIDRAALNDAAEAMMRGEVDDAATAYDRAVARRPAPQQASSGGTVFDEAPFPAPGEGFSPPAVASSFPLSDTAPSDAMRNARGLFARHKATFSPRAAGDDAGRALRKIVDQDATPNEIAAMLYGGTREGQTGLSVRIHDRLGEALGEGHPALDAVRQGLVSKVIDGGPGDVASRLEHLLNGNGRVLAERVLTPEQRAGLEAFRVGSMRAAQARESLPDWVRRLADTGFDPNRITADLFGAGIPGSRPGQAEFARGLRSILGPESPEWSNLRQAAWLRLVQHGEAAPITPAKEAARIRAFVGGEGSGLASTMFSETERATMLRYADALKVLDLPNGGRMPDAGRTNALAGRIIDMIAGAAAFKVAGPGGIGAVAAVRPGQRIMQGGIGAARANRSFSGGAPVVPPPMPEYAPQFGSRAGAQMGLLEPRIAGERRRAGAR